MIKNHQSLYIPGELIETFNSISFYFEPEVLKWIQKNLERLSTKISDFLDYRLENGDREHVAHKLQLLTLVQVEKSDF